MKTAKVVRSRNFSMTTYLSRAEIEEYVSRSNVANYAYIPHNKDVYDEDIKDDSGVVIHEIGSIKIPHFHLVITYANARTLSAVKSDFVGYSQNTLVEYVRDMESALAYLTHKNAPNKYQYSVDIVCSNYGYFRGSFSSATIEDNNAFRIINDMEMGYSHYALVRKYGREYVVNYRRYCDMQNLCFGREIDSEKIALENQVLDLQDELANLKRENEKLRYQNARYEKQAMQSRKNVMCFTANKTFVAEKVPKYLAEECPFD